MSWIKQEPVEEHEMDFKGSSVFENFSLKHDKNEEFTDGQGIEFKPDVKDLAKEKTSGNEEDNNNTSISQVRKSNMYNEI